MSNKLNFTLIVLLMMSSFNLTFGQTDSINRREIIYNRVYKNIAAYYIQYSVNRSIDLDKGNSLYQGLSSYFFDRCLPDNGYRLEMEITKLNWQYPIAGYQVYQVHLNGFQFENITIGKSKIIKIDDGPIDAPPSNYYLICIDSNNLIKFISGGYFLNDISSDFALNNNNPDSYIDYLKFKTYHLLTKDIQFLKKKGHFLSYTANSQSLDRKLIITIDRRTPSKLKINILSQKSP